MNSLTYDLCEKLKNDLVIEGKNEVVLRSEERRVGQECRCRGSSDH